MYPTKKLWEIWVYINWKAFKPSDWWKSGFPIVRIQNLNWNWEYNFFYWEIEEKYFIEKWDILISWSASLDIYIWKWEKSVLNQHIFKVDLNEKIIERTFFYYLIKNILKEIISKTHWVWMKHITKWKFESIPIPLPPLPTQQKIVSKLDCLFEKLDQAITLTKQNLANVEELNKSVLEKIFKECEEKYEKRKLGEVCEIIWWWTPKTEISEYWKDEIVWLSPTDLPEIWEIIEINNSAKKISKLWLEKSSAKILPKWTVIFSSRATIWKIAISTIELSTNQWFANFICSEKIFNKFLAYTLKNFTKNIINLSNSTTFKEVNKTNLRSFQIPLPPLPEQQKIVEYLDNIFAKNKILQEKYKQDLQNLEELKQSILKQAFEDEDFIK